MTVERFPYLVSEINDARVCFHNHTLTEVCRISTGERQSIGKARTKEDTGEIYHYACPTEIDSHADTHCFGRNFRPLSWTGHECSVAPFLAEYSEVMNIQICSGATAFTTEGGEVLILVFGQGLWFGNWMEKSLINPYQCRAFGTSLCDDLMDPHREMGINKEDFTSRYPSDEELCSCWHVLLSGEENWDPSKDHFMISSMEAERYHRFKSTANERVLVIAGVSWTAAPMILVQDDVAFHDFDRALAQVSLGMTQDTIDQRLLANVNVKLSRYGYATITNDRHHGVSPQLLAQKWGIGLEKAKATLKCTTQKVTRSATMPLHRRYRTDLMSQRLRRLSTTWYTDTLFAKEKSLVGNRCA